MSTDVGEASDADWMPACEAFKLVSQRNGSVDATFSIARRAYAGVLRTWAARFRKEQKAARGEKETVDLENAELPKEFWWAKGEAALDQNWESGDFSTHVDQKYEWQAFGVKFERSGIEVMLAPATEETSERPTVGAVSAESDSGGEKPQPKVKGRNLTHDHPYAAAKAALYLMTLPEAERDRLTGPSVGITMQDHYKKKAGKFPHQDNLDEFGTSVLRALKEHWQSKEG